MGLNRLGIDYEMVGITEIDKYAIKSYMAIHGETKNFGSICDVKGSDLPQIDLYTYSFPCFPKGTMVMTVNGYAMIEDVKAGDLVLTHDNTYQKVLRNVDNGINSQESSSQNMSIIHIIHNSYYFCLKPICGRFI
jgi:hypothetical protein